MAFAGTNISLSQPDITQKLTERIDDLKQKIAAWGKRIRRFSERSRQFNQNCLFQSDQKRLYKSLERPEVCGAGPGQDQADTVAFWRGLWSEPVNHSEGPWMEVVASQSASVTPMDSVTITPEDVAEVVRRAPNWKSPGLDGLHHYWLKGFVVCHAVLARQFQEALDQKSLPSLFTTGITHLVPKDQDTTDPSKYRPITCNACKERWTRIRDNHRKALNLRKTKSGQAASNIKTPKFSQELSFLTPYLNDEEERRSNLSPRSANNNEETQLESLNELGYPDKNVSSDAQSEHSTQSLGSSRIIRKKSSFATSQASQAPTAASVLQDYLTRTAETRNQSHPLLDFFINMAKTVKTFSLQDQVNIKAQLFKMVNNVEKRLATTSIDRVSDPSTSNVRIVSNVMLSPAPTGSNSISIGFFKYNDVCCTCYE
ncbi:unnamed protein product [Parnassius apollo]|uniref:(apollo) hypothetical protein n=1 Tax=Parnassius apollo TaxID=110799 RepID=A0A8S3W451_PARAO|nr:unnamed protein product [Parnassius apollo]